MTRLTPAELQAARRRAQEDRALEQQRMAEEKALEEKQAEERSIWLAEAKQTYIQLESVTLSLYEEVDKLSRKWPVMPITQLMLDKTNKVIRTLKDLLKNEEDDFAKDITEIIPAGDLPENRDIVLILGQIRAALKRFERTYAHEWDKKSGYRSESGYRSGYDIF